MKICSKCHISKDESEFNHSSRNKSGCRSACRECEHARDCEYRQTPIARAVKNTWHKSEQGRASQRVSDRKRNRTEHRRAYKREQSKQESYRAKKNAATNRLKKCPAYRIKLLAHYAVRNAIRDGIMTPLPCEHVMNGNCSGKIHAHHDDYTKPLIVRWLCIRHHTEFHRPPVL